MQETEEAGLRFLDQEDPLEEGMATHSSVLSGIIRWLEGPGGLRWVGLKASRDLGTEHAHAEGVAWRLFLYFLFPSAVDVVRVL